MSKLIRIIHRPIAPTRIIRVGTSLVVQTTPGEGGTIIANSTDLSNALGVSKTGIGLTVFDNSPSLTGTPLAPTAANNTDTTQIATTAFVQAFNLLSLGRQFLQRY